MNVRELRDWLRRDFPLVEAHPDVAGLLRDADVLASLGPAMAAPFRHRGATKVLAPEARGPIFGALVARELGCGLVLARKAGRNHPGADTRASGGVSWSGEAEVFQARAFDLSEGDRVLVVDDWITTGSSLRAQHQVVTGAGATYLGASVIVDKAATSTTEALLVQALVRFGDISGAHERHR